MIPTPDEKRTLADLLMKMQTSDSNDYALCAHQYYELLKDIKTRPPEKVLSGDEMKTYAVTISKLASQLELNSSEAEDIALREIFEKRKKT